MSGSSRRKAAGQADVFPDAGWRVVMGDRVVEVRGRRPRRRRQRAKGH